jgi:hypothetical protein
MSVFEVIHSSKKEGLARKGRRGRGGPERKKSRFDGPSKATRPDISSSPCFLYLLTSPCY